MNAHDRHVANDNHLYQRICESAARCECCWFVWLGVVDHARDRIVPVAAAGHEDHYLDGIRVDVSATDYGRGPVGCSARDNCIWIIDDIESDARMAPWLEAALRRGYRSVAAFPLRDGEQVVAVLAVYSASSFNADALERFIRLTYAASQMLSTGTVAA
jgi:GAF domain-containing protein